jgi:hypothetical protein
LPQSRRRGGGSGLPSQWRRGLHFDASLVAAAGASAWPARPRRQRRRAPKIAPRCALALLATWRVGTGAHVRIDSLVHGPHLPTHAPAPRP